MPDNKAAVVVVTEEVVATVVVAPVAVETVVEAAVAVAAVAEAAKIKLVQRNVTQFSHLTFFGFFSEYLRSAAIGKN